MVQNSIPATAQLSVATRLNLIARDIKLSHSIFALPFAILGAFMARPATMLTRQFGGALILVVLCMVCARTWAMLINRLADRSIDADNPRTSSRAFASGRLDARFGLFITLLTGGAFVASAALFWIFFANPWPTLLSVPVLLWIASYSFTKRFTWACHLFLGTSLAASPLAAAIAIDPRVLGLPLTGLTSEAGPIGTRYALWALSGMVMLWVAGFDIIYSLQDVDTDRRQHLFSIPSRLGVRAALWISRVLHIGAFALLALCWRNEPRFNALFGVGVCAVAILLIAEHVVLSRQGKAGLHAAFFTLNGIVSLVVGVLGIADLTIA